MAMSNTSQSSEFDLSDKTFFSILFLFLFCCFVLTASIHNAKNSAHTDRVMAWQAVIESAPTVEEREVLSHYASRVRGCFVDRSTDPDGLSPSYSLIPSQYRENYRKYLVAHEQACLVNLRGEIRSSAPEFQDVIFSISVPE